MLRIMPQALVLYSVPAVSGARVYIIVVHDQVYRERRNMKYFILCVHSMAAGIFSSLY